MKNYLIMALVILATGCDYDHPLDDTDNKEENKRSGLALYTDHQTGCQYLSAGLFGGITPRVDGEQRHLGCKY